MINSNILTQNHTKNKSRIIYIMTKRLPPRRTKANGIVVKARMNGNAPIPQPVVKKFPQTPSFK